MKDSSAPQHLPPAEDEIDLVEIIRFVWDARKTVVVVAAIVVAIGLFIALFSTPRYTVEARILPEIQQQRTGTSALLRQFGGMAGLSFGSDGYEALRPDLYPSVLQATPFFYELLQKEIRVSTLDAPVTVQEYVQQHMGGSAVLGTVSKFTVGLPGTIMGLLKGKPKEDVPLPGVAETAIPRLTRAEFEAIEVLRGSIASDMDMQSWVISVSAVFPDPLAAAQISQLSVDYLSDYIISYRIDKARQDLEFVMERHAEKKAEFYDAQHRLARFRDANRNIATAMAQTEEQRLLDEYNLAFGVYNQLAQRLEETRLKLQEETPMIKLLEPVQVPLERSHPKRARMMMIAVFLGGVVGVGFVFGRREFFKLKEKMQD